MVALLSKTDWPASASRDCVVPVVGAPPLSVINLAASGAITSWDCDGVTVSTCCTETIASVVAAARCIAGSLPLLKLSSILAIVVSPPCKPVGNFIVDLVCSSRGVACRVAPAEPFRLFAGVSFRTALSRCSVSGSGRTCLLSAFLLGFSMEEVVGMTWDCCCLVATCKRAANRPSSPDFGAGVVAGPAAGRSMGAMARAGMGVMVYPVSKNQWSVWLLFHVPCC